MDYMYINSKHIVSIDTHLEEESTWMEYIPNHTTTTGYLWWKKTIDHGPSYFGMRIYPISELPPEYILRGTKIFKKAGIRIDFVNGSSIYKQFDTNSEMEGSAHKLSLRIKDCITL